MLKKSKAINFVAAALASMSLVHCSSDESSNTLLSDACINGTVSGLSGTLVLEVNESEKATITEDGQFSMSGCNQGAYTLKVFANPVGQACDISNGKGTVSEGDPASVTVTCSSALFTLNQEASFAVGQANLTDTGYGTSASAYYRLWGNPLIADGKLYVPDYRNNRVMGYLSVPTESGVDADFVLGQEDFESSSDGWDANQLESPAGLATDGTHLFVATGSGVVMYDSLPSETGASASVFLGLTEFGTESDYECIASEMNYPEGLFITHNKLFVADTYNHRVLVWNAVPTTWSVAPDYVLGQPDTETCEDYDDPTSLIMNEPHGIWSDGTRLVIADSGFDRVLIWNDISGFASQADITAPDLVLGQADFESDVDVYYALDENGDETSEGFGPGMGYPEAVVSDGQKLIVADDDGRIFVWNTFPTENYAVADLVLGDSSLTPDDMGVNDNGSWVGSSNGMYFDGRKLYVSDWTTNRVLVFEAQ